MNPILLAVPELLETERLMLRAPRIGEAPEINQAVHESFKELHEWMLWANVPPTIEETEIFSRNSLAQFHVRQLLNFRAYLKHDSAFAGNLSLFNINWSIPSFEIGYWLRTSLCGNGYMTEAVQALTTKALGALKGNRVELRCDENNNRSRKVAARSGFALEGILKNDTRTPAGELRSTCVYAVTPQTWPGTLGGA